MSCTPKRWPREAAPARRIVPSLPPLVDRLIRDMVCDREQGEEAEIAEASTQGIHALEHQFNQTNHMGLRTFLGWIAVVGPERASRVATPNLRHLGVALVPTAEANGEPAEEAAAGLIRLQEHLGALAATHLSAWSNRRLDQAELAELERLAAQLRQTLDVYLAGARVCAGGRS